MGEPPELALFRAFSEMERSYGFADACCCLLNFSWESRTTPQGLSPSLQDVRDAVVLFLEDWDGPGRLPAVAESEAQTCPSWLREADRRYFLGCGWAITPEGPRRLVAETDVESCLPGADGSAAEAPSESCLPGANGSAGAQASASQQPKPGARKRALRVTVRWESAGDRWRVAWRDAGQRKEAFFAASGQKGDGRDWQAARQRALMAAVVLRKELLEVPVADGGPRADVVSAEVTQPTGTTPPRSRAAEKSQDCGITWSEAQGKWVVRCHGTTRSFPASKYREEDGSMDAAEQRALAAAVAFHEQMEMEQAAFAQAFPADERHQQATPADEQAAQAAEEEAARAERWRAAPKRPRWRAGTLNPGTLNPGTLNGR